MSQLPKVPTEPERPSRSERRKAQGARDRALRARRYPLGFVECGDCGHAFHVYEGEKPLTKPCPECGCDDHFTDLRLYATADELESFGITPLSPGDTALGVGEPESLEFPPLLPGKGAPGGP